MNVTRKFLIVLGYINIDNLEESLQEFGNIVSKEEAIEIMTRQITQA